MSSRCCVLLAQAAAAAESDEEDLNRELEKTLKETYPEFLEPMSSSANPAPAPASTSAKSNMPQALADAFQKASNNASSASSTPTAAGNGKAGHQQPKAKAKTKTQPQNPWAGHENGKRCVFRLLSLSSLNVSRAKLCLEDVHAAVVAAAAEVGDQQTLAVPVLRNPPVRRELLLIRLES